MQKTKKEIFVLGVLIVFVALVTYFLYNAGFTRKMVASLEKLNGTVTTTKNNEKPKVLTIINTSGEKKVSEDVVIFIDVLSSSKVNIEYSYDMKSWNKVNDITKEDNIYTARVVFTKNMNKTVYARAVNEYNNMSEYASTKVIIDKK